MSPAQFVPVYIEQSITCSRCVERDLVIPLELTFQPVVTEHVVVVIYVRFAPWLVRSASVVPRNTHDVKPSKGFLKFPYRPRLPLCQPFGCLSSRKVVGLAQVLVNLPRDHVSPADVVDAWVAFLTAVDEGQLNGLGDKQADSFFRHV